MGLPRHPTTMENLPGEVLSDIFIRLLAKQLAQMRCICKSWNALLSESSFVKSHLNRSIQNKNEILLFFWRFSLNCSPFSARPSLSPDLEPTNLIKLPVNLISKDGYVAVIGSANGLMCFSYKSYDDFRVHIWNPSLSVVLTLPPCSMPSRSLSSIHFGFGFDPKTDDYKVVRLTGHTRPCRMVPQGEVYSMRKGSWDLISQEFPSHITQIIDQDEVCIDGHDVHLHWVGYIDEELKAQTIVAFDLGAETFRAIPPPDSILNYNVERSNVLGVLGGKLCVMSKVLRGVKCEVWVMDEYGVAESWVRHHVFSKFSSYTRPYGFTSHNEFLFQTHEGDVRFCLYDPVASSAQTFELINSPYGITKIVEYVDSLVWVAPVARDELLQHLQISALKGHHISGWSKGLQ